MHIEIINQCMNFFNCKASLDIYEEGKILTKTPSKEVFALSQNWNGVYFLGKNHIALKKRSTLLMLDTLCHEIVHYQQFEDKRLMKISYNQYLFDHKKYKIDTPYAERPWEKEAFEKELIYYTKFLWSLDKSTIKELQEEFENEQNEICRDRSQRNTN